MPISAMLLDHQQRPRGDACRDSTSCAFPAPQLKREWSRLAIFGRANRSYHDISNTWLVPGFLISREGRSLLSGPRTEPSGPHSGTRLPPRVFDGEALLGPRMKDAGPGEKVIRQLRDPSPGFPRTGSNEATEAPCAAMRGRSHAVISMPRTWCTTRWFVLTRNARAFAPDTICGFG